MSFDPEKPELVAYYRSRDGERPGPRCVGIYEALRDQLPAYMVPAYLERIERLPLTTTGKIDRRGLPPPSGPRLARPTAASTRRRRPSWRS